MAITDVMNAYITIQTGGYHKLAIIGEAQITDAAHCTSISVYKILHASYIESLRKDNNNETTS